MEPVTVSSRRTCHSEVNPRPRGDTALIVCLRSLVVLAAALFIVFVLWAASLHLFCAAEFDLYGGWLQDAVRQFRSGQPIYAAPGTGFIAQVAPPLHTWLTAAIARVAPRPFLAARLLSLLCTLAIAGILWRSVRRATGSVLYAFLSVGLFAAAYGACGGSLDSERPDALLSLLLLAAMLCVLHGRNTLPAAALFSCAALTKTTALIPLAGAVLALALTGRRRHALWLLVASGSAFLLVMLALHRSTEGWSTYYTLLLPLTRGLQSEQGNVFSVVHLPHFAPLIALTIVLTWLVPVRSFGDTRIPITLLVVTTLTMVIVSFGYETGTTADLLPLAALLAYAGPIAAHSFTVTPEAPGTRAAVALMLLLGQFVSYLYDPAVFDLRTELIALSTQSFSRVLASLEAKGPVWILSHGGLSREPHPLIGPLSDVIHASGNKLPAPLALALNKRRFAAIVIDDLWSIPFELRKEVLRSYYVSEKVELSLWSRTPTATAPAWVLAPRAQPLDSVMPEVVFDDHVYFGMILADMLHRMHGDNGVDLAADSRLDTTTRSLVAALPSGNEALLNGLCRANTDGELCRGLLRYTHAGRGAFDAQQLESLRNVWNLQVQNRDALVMERDQLLDEIDCLRVRSPGHPELCGALPAADARSP
jgi:hypothetical protein